ncbi:hypothetical protein D3C86_1543130 [compost metagenome]
MPLCFISGNHHAVGRFGLPELKSVAFVFRLGNGFVLKKFIVPAKCIFGLVFYDACIFQLLGKLLPGGRILPGLQVGIAVPVSVHVDEKHTDILQELADLPLPVLYNSSLLFGQGGIDNE